MKHFNIDTSYIIGKTVSKSVITDWQMAGKAFYFHIISGIYLPFVFNVDLQGVWRDIIFMPFVPTANYSSPEIILLSRRFLSCWFILYYIAAVDDGYIGITTIVPFLKIPVQKWDVHTDWGYKVVLKQNAQWVICIEKTSR